MPPAYPPGHISSPASSSTGPYPSAFAKAAMKAKSKPQSRQGPPKQGDYWRDEEQAPSDTMMYVGRLGSDPAPLAKKLRKYPSDFFLETADGYLVARYCMFLLQALMLLVRVFRIPNELKEKYGERGMTAALYALFFCHTEDMDNPAAHCALYLDRHLYGRMLRTSKGVVETVDKVLKEEWELDRRLALQDRIDRYIAEKIAQKISLGYYPKTNLNYDIEEQWSVKWKASCIHVWHLLVSCLSRHIPGTVACCNDSIQCTSGSQERLECCIASLDL